MKINWLKRTAIAMLYIPTALMAQDVDKPLPAPVPRVYLGGGTGCNDFGIMGIGAEFPVSRKLQGYFDLGVGGWGSKVGAGGTYYFDFINKGSSMSAGISSASGIENMNTGIVDESNVNKDSVFINAKPLYTLNIKYAYSFPLGRSHRNKFQLSYGYSIPLSTDNYEIISPGTKENDDIKRRIKILEPGGLILGAKIMFGIGNK